MDVTRYKREWQQNKQGFCAWPRRESSDIGHPLYRTWLNMRTRCYSKSVPNYASYGGKGGQDVWSVVCII